MMHRAWSSMVKVTYCFSRLYVKFQGHTALKISNLTQIGRFRTVTPVWPMAMKCCTKLETAKERCPIVFQGHPSNFKVTRDKTTDFDPNWAFPDYRPVAAFKSLRFALFIWTLYWIQPHLKTFTRPVMWVSWILSFHQYAWIFMATTGDVWIIPTFRIWDYVLHVEHISCVITNC